MDNFIKSPDAFEARLSEITSLENRNRLEQQFLANSLKDAKPLLTKLWIINSAFILGSVIAGFLWGPLALVGIGLPSLYNTYELWCRYQDFKGSAQLKALAEIRKQTQDFYSEAIEQIKRRCK